MLREGFSKVEIAKRAGCSTKQVRRIERDVEETLNNNLPAPDPETENELRKFYLKFESAERVSERFGVSRQAILKGA